MEQPRKNKEAILNYFNSLSGKTKTRDLLSQYTNDRKLIEHIEFFDSVFPRYEIFADEMTAEENRVVVKARIKGIHKGELNGIPPTYKAIEFPFAISYELSNGIITNHWLIADQAMLMEQLGVMSAV